MSNAPQRAPLITTPRVVLQYPKLSAPDYGSKEFPKPDGEYGTRFLMKAGDPITTAFLAKLNPLVAAAEEAARTEFKAMKAEARRRIEQQGGLRINPIYTELLDQETEEPTGEIAFKVAMKASGVNKKTGKKWERKPNLFDSMLNPIKNAPDIWSGTIARVSFEARPYFIPGTGVGGLKLALVGAQIIELRSGSGPSAEQQGFEREDDGYSANAEANASGFVDEDTPATEVSDEEF